MFSQGRPCDRHNVRVSLYSSSRSAVCFNITLSFIELGGRKSGWLQPPLCLLLSQHRRLFYRDCLTSSALERSELPIVLLCLEISRKRFFSRSESSRSRHFILGAAQESASETLCWIYSALIASDERNIRISCRLSDGNLKAPVF